jgi:hypothetical protein
MTLLCDLEGLIRYASILVPAGRHDISQLREELPKLEELLDIRDVLLFDKAYKGIEEELSENVVYIKHKKPANSFLCEEKKVENTEMEKIRSHTEHSIGKFKGRFGILRTKFRHDREYLTPIAHLCIAICCEIKKYFKNEKNYSEEWTSPVTVLSKDRKTSRKVRKFLWNFKFSMRKFF